MGWFYLSGSFVMGHRNTGAFGIVGGDLLPHPIPTVSVLSDFTLVQLVWSLFALLFCAGDTGSPVVPSSAVPLLQEMHSYQHVYILGAHIGN